MGLPLHTPMRLTPCSITSKTPRSTPLSFKTLISINKRWTQVFEQFRTQAEFEHVHFQTSKTRIDTKFVVIWLVYTPTFKWYNIHHITWNALSTIKFLCRGSQPLLCPHFKCLLCFLECLMLDLWWFLLYSIWSVGASDIIILSGDFLLSSYLALVFCGLLIENSFDNQFLVLLLQVSG